MKIRTAAAWELIRAADPAASTDVGGASEHPSAQGLLHRITERVPADVEGDLLTGLDVGPRPVLPARRRGVAAGLAAAAVVLLVVATALAVRHQDTTAAQSPHRQTTPQGYSQALLAELPLPNGARRVNSPPIPELKLKPLAGNGILDARLAWWAVPGSFAATVARVSRAAALPPHWKITVSSDDESGGRSSGWLIEVRDPAARFVSSVNVTVAAHGATVGMAAQVATYAIPVRTAEQVIPASIDSATFTFGGDVGRSFSSRLSLTLKGERVKALVNEINTTPTFVMLAVVSCPSAGGSVTVTFRRGSQHWSLEINDGSFLCNAPTLTGADGTSLVLTPSTAFLTDALAAAGLPSNYLRR